MSLAPSTPAEAQIKPEPPTKAEVKVEADAVVPSPSSLRELPEAITSPSLKASFDLASVTSDICMEAPIKIQIDSDSDCDLDHGGKPSGPKDRHATKRAYVDESCIDKPSKRPAVKDQGCTAEVPDGEAGQQQPQQTPGGEGLTVTQLEYMV
jgi:hypothetical protein